MREVVATAVIVSAALTGCGTERPGDRRPGVFSAATLGACPETGTVDGPDAGEFVSSPGAWVRIDAIDVTSVNGLATTDVRGTFVVVGGDEAMATPLGAAPATLRMHGSTAKAAAEALALGAKVHAHTGAADDPRYVAFGLAIKDAEFAFLGECQDRLLTQPIARRLAPDAAARLNRLVGATSPELRRELVQAPPAPTGETILNPEVTALDVLAKLSTGLFTLTTPPASWYGPHTLCTKIAAGWADCVDLAAEASATISVNYYFDPAAPTVEVWVLDHAADVSRPLAKVATFNLATLAARARIDLDKPGVNLRLTLAETPSLADVLAGSAADGAAVEDVRLVRD